YRAGVQIEKILFYDTMLGDYVLAGNRAAQDHPNRPDWHLDLDSLCKRYGVPQKHWYVHKLLNLGINPEDIPNQALRAYCKNDVKITEQIFLKQRLILLGEGLLPVFFIRNLTTPVISEME